MKKVFRVFKPIIVGSIVGSLAFSAIGEANKIDNTYTVESIDDSSDLKVLNIGDNDEMNLFSKKVEKYNKKQIPVSIEISSDSTNLNNIYRDVEYVKAYINDYEISGPVIFNINSIMNNEKLEPSKKVELIKAFANKIESNRIYLMIEGTDENICLLNNLFDLSNYDVMIDSEDKNIEYEGVYHFIRNGKKIEFVSGYGIDSVDSFINIIKDNNLNDSDNLKNNGSYIIKEDDTFKTLSFKFNMGIDDIVKYNDLKNENYLKPGVELEMPSINNETNTPNLYTSSLPEKNGQVLGIDISEFQTSPENWDVEKLKAAGCRYAIIRTGYSTKDVDEKLEENYNKLVKEDIGLGYYHVDYSYLKFDSYETSVDQLCSNAINLIQNKRVDLPVYLDFESNVSEVYSDKEKLEFLLNTWKDRLEEVGYMPGIYANRTNLQTMFEYYGKDYMDNFHLMVAGSVVDQYCYEKDTLLYSPISNEDMKTPEEFNGTDGYNFNNYGFNIESNKCMVQVSNLGDADSFGIGTDLGRQDIDYAPVSYIKQFVDVKTDDVQIASNGNSDSLLKIKNLKTNENNYVEVSKVLAIVLGILSGLAVEMYTEEKEKTNYIRNGIKKILKK